MALKRAFRPTTVVEPFSPAASQLRAWRTDASSMLRAGASPATSTAAGIAPAGGGVANEKVETATR